MTDFESFDDIKNAYIKLRAKIEGQNKTLIGASTLEELSKLQNEFAEMEPAFVALTNIGSAKKLDAAKSSELQTISRETRSALIARNNIIEQYNHSCADYKTQGETLATKINNLKNQINLDKSCTVSNAVAFILKSGDANLSLDTLKKTFPTLNNSIINSLLDLNNIYIKFRATHKEINEFADAKNLAGISSFDPEYAKVFATVNLIQVITQDSLFIPNNKDKEPLTNPLLIKLVLTQELSVDNLAAEGEHHIKALNSLMSGQQTIDARLNDNIKRFDLSNVTQLASQVKEILKQIFNQKSDTATLDTYENTITQEVSRQQKIQPFQQSYPEFTAFIKQNPAIKINAENINILRHLMTDIAQSKISNNKFTKKFAEATGYLLTQAEFLKIIPQPKSLTNEQVQGYISDLVDFNNFLMKNKPEVTKRNILDRTLEKTNKIKSTEKSTYKVNPSFYSDVSKQLSNLINIELMLKQQQIKLTPQLKVLKDEVNVTERNIIKCLKSHLSQLESQLHSSRSLDTLQTVAQQTQAFYTQLHTQLPEMLGKEGQKLVQGFDRLNSAVSHEISLLNQKNQSHTASSANTHAKRPEFFVSAPAAGQQAAETVNNKVDHSQANSLRPVGFGKR